jgi:hypothetical protein
MPPLVHDGKNFKRYRYKGIMGKKRKGKPKRKIPKNDTEFHIPSVILNIYLIPLAKISLFLWLVVAGKIIAGCAIYILFGLSKLYYYKKKMSLIDNSISIVDLIACCLLWPALDIYTFIPPSDNDSE